MANYIAVCETGDQNQEGGAYHQAISVLYYTVAFNIFIKFRYLR